jgi:hypothetical protein
LFFFLLAIVLSVRPFTAFDYSFGIFKHLYYHLICSRGIYLEHTIRENKICREIARLYNNNINMITDITDKSAAVAL